jgi:hypothetical protein
LPSPTKGLSCRLYFTPSEAPESEIQNARLCIDPDFRDV